MIKKNYICNFHDGCQRCSQRNNCISATSVTMDKRKYFLKLLRKKEPQNEAMKQGQIDHEGYFINVPKVEEITFPKVRGKLFKGEKVAIKDVAVCSPFFGFRGVLDCLELKLDKQDLNVLITEYKSGYNKKHFTQIACFPANTMIFTDKGLIPISKCEIGMGVVTHDGTFKKITKVLQINYDGIAYKIRPSHAIPIITTSDHPFLSAKLKEKHNNSYVVWDKKTKKYCTNRYDDKEGIRGHEKLIWTQAKDLKKRDIIVIPKIKEKVTNQFIENDINKLIIAGYYLAEGCLDFHHYYKKKENPLKISKKILNIENDTYHRISFSFAKNETKYINEIKKAAEALGVKYKIWTYRENVDIIELYSRELSKFLEQFGKGAANKKLPPWFFYLEKEGQMLLIEKLWNGDGHGSINKKSDGQTQNCSLTTVSEILAKQVWFCLLNMNISTSIYNRHKKDNILKNGQIIIARNDRYDVRINSKKHRNGKRIAFDDDYIYLPIREIEETSLNELVYNLEVEDNASYLAEGIAVHNCYGLIMSDPNMRIVEEINLKKKKRRIFRFYPMKPFNKNINICLDIRGKNQMNIDWMKNNLLTEWANGVTAMVQKKAKTLKSLHKADIKFINEIPLCKDCSEWCGLHKYCDKAKHEPKVKQRYIGRRNILIKTKPKIRTDEIRIK